MQRKDIKIIIILKGGFGNQLFQFMFSEYLKINYKVDIFFEDSDSFKDDPYKRSPRVLDFFNISNIKNIYSPSNKVLRKISRSSRKLANRVLPKRLRWHFEEDALSNLDFINKISFGSAILDGHWMDIKYLDSNKYVPILKERLNELYHEELPEDFIKNNGLHNIGIGIRSFILNGSEEIKPLPEDYYLKSIKKIKDQFGESNIYIFTDDIHWVKKNYPCLKEYISFEGNFPDLVELFAMTQMNSFVLSLSSFHWWGAYMADSDIGLIIYPKIMQSHKYFRNLIPNNWIQH